MSAVDLATLCADHLAEEERVLASVLAGLRALQEAFTQGSGGPIEHAALRHRDFTKQIDEMKLRRERMRTELANRLGLARHRVTLSRALEGIAEPASLMAAAARVRQIADDVVRTNHWLAVHLRIHLGAYERILRDLTGTTSSSGRYGPRGKTEASAYRPLLEIHG